jgi:hypothetical protein
MLMSRSPLVLAAVVLATWSGVADAQVVTRAPRGFRGIFGTRQPTDPSRPRHDLLLNLNAVGGIDDNVGAGDTVGPPVAGSSESGATSQIDVSLDYRRSSAARSFGLAGWGAFSNYYGDTTMPASRNGGVGVTGQTEMTRRTTVGGGARVNYLSQLPVSQGLALGQVADTIPPSAGLTGLYDRGSWATSLDGNVERRWTQRSSTRLDYSFATTEFTDGRDGDDRSHQVQATHRRLFSRASSIDATYEFAETRVGLSDGGDPGRPRTEHRAHGGVTMSRRLSTTRTLDVSLHGGALYVDATTGGTNADYQLWTPFAQASIRAGVFGQWAIETAYERSTESIPGFRQPESYITDTVTTSLGGVIGRRVDVVFSGAFAAGDVGVDASRSEYVTTGAAAQMRVSIIRNMAAVVGYSYYHYRFTDTILPVGLPPEFDRNALRVGLTFALPIYGGDNSR